MRLLNCTLNGNSATEVGGGIFSQGLMGYGPVRLGNSLFQTGAHGENFFISGGSYTSDGGNLSSDHAGGDGGTGPGGYLNGAGDKRNTNPKLDPAGLKDNGGYTFTIALLSDSPAINAGNDSFAPLQDQRGYNRVGVRDTGAFEFGGTPPSNSTPTPTATPTSTATPTITPTPSPIPSTLVNLSTRLRVLNGDNVMIGGMIAIGTADKKVIIRAIGPTLTDFGVPGALPDPTLELLNQGGFLIAANDDWASSPQAAQIANSGLAPGKAAESAIIATLTANKPYTTVVRGKNGQTGVGMLEIFDLDQAASSKLGNISTRGFVDVDDNVMIAGFIVGPANGESVKVLVRALGPTPGDFGVPDFLADPTLDLVGENGTVIRSNDSWQSHQGPEITATGLAPTYPQEAALIETLTPGAYTAIVRGSGGTTGVGLVEVYNLP